MAHRLALFDLSPAAPLGRPPVCRPRHCPLHHAPGRLCQSGNILHRCAQALLDLGHRGDLCLVILLFHGVLWLRRASYEVFLILHILLAVFTIVGCWYHVYYWKGFTGVYELWIYLVCAVWFFDRLVRVLRVAKNGVCRATVTEISADTVRVDVAGVRWTLTPGRHAFVFFPTLQPLRAWENHPFSVIPTALLRPRPDAQKASPAGSIKKEDASSSNDVEGGKGGLS